MKQQISELSLYGVYDTVSGSFSKFLTASNDGMAARNALKTLDVPIRDSLLCCLGFLECHLYSPETKVEELNPYVHNPILDSAFLPLDDFRVVPWSVYKFPETVAEAVAPLGASPDEVRQIVSSLHSKLDSKEE